jgi:hypothetical protein
MEKKKYLPLSLTNKVYINSQWESDLDMKKFLISKITIPSEVEGGSSTLPTVFVPPAPSLIQITDKTVYVQVFKKVYD